MKLTFLCAIGQVAGSRYLVEHNGTRILVDCGMFQGPKNVTEKNFDAFPVDPTSLDAVVLTHAHIDHTGYIPALVNLGFNGSIYCSQGTYELCRLLLKDSGSLQEGRARSSNRRGGPDHPPAIALYTEQDAENALTYFKTVEDDTVFSIGTLQVTLIRSGHILGSSFVIISDGTKKLTFSGDLGRPHDLIMKAPTHLKETDYLVIESTYGDRLHENIDPTELLAEIIHETVNKGGVIIIPCFAVGRVQTILYCLYQLKQRNAIPDIPIFLDSPMAINVTDLLCKFNEEFKLPGSLCKDIADIATFTYSGEDSKHIDNLTSPAIIIAGSGMADGGRVMFHLKKFITDAKNTVVFVGFQAPGTGGHALVQGAQAFFFRGIPYKVNAEIKTIDAFSAHADYEEILQWLSYFEQAPKKVFITHGEEEAALSLQKKIQERFGWTAIIPKYLEPFDLD